MDNEKTIFVFYTLKTNSHWKYPHLPKDWRWVGSGSVSPINHTPPKYEREEQFNGTAISQKKTREYLDQVFTKLKKDNIIKRYKIRNSYLP